MLLTKCCSLTAQSYLEVIFKTNANFPTEKAWNKTHILYSDLKKKKNPTKLITRYLELGKLTLPESLEVKLHNITILKYLRIKYQEAFLLRSFVCLGVGIPGKQNQKSINTKPAKIANKGACQDLAWSVWTRWFYFTSSLLQLKFVLASRWRW